MLVLMNTEDMLADLGYESMSAATVDGSLALIGSQVFDAAMLDMNLDGDGTNRIAAALAARGVPFAFATGYVGTSLREGYLERPVLQKPFMKGDLAAMLTGLLAH